MMIIEPSRCTLESSYISYVHSLGSLSTRVMDCDVYTRLIIFIVNNSIIISEDANKSFAHVCVGSKVNDNTPAFNALSY